MRVGKILANIVFISETVRDRLMVTGSLIGSHRGVVPVTLSDLERQSARSQFFG